MFGMRHRSGKAAHAWHDLRDVAADRAKDLGEGARNRLGDVGDVARHRTSLAWDALAGRPAPTRKLPAVIVGIAGVALGWGAAQLYGRRKLEVDEAMAAVGNELRDTKTSIDERMSRAKATTGSPIEKAKAAVGKNSSAVSP